MTTTTLLFSGGEAGTQTLKFQYTNWRGETSERACRAHTLEFGTNEWHKEPTLMLRGYDLSKGGMRSYAVDGIDLSTIVVM